MSIHSLDCISNVLFDFVNNNFEGDYYDSGSFRLKQLLKDFIREENYLTKRVIAKDVVKQLFKLRGKDEASFPFEMLKKMELENTFFDGYRDHIIHTVYVFLLGYFLYKNNESVNAIINEKILQINEEYFNESGNRDSETEESNFIYMWSLISIYHDYGYVFEHSDEERKVEFFNTLINNDYNCLNKADIKLEKRFYNEIVVNYLNSLLINKSAVSGLDLIKDISDTTNLSNPEYNGIQSYLNFCLEVDYSDRPKYLDHGIISSLLFLKLSNIIFLERNHVKKDDYIWNENIQITYFKCVAQAIAVHNIYVNLFKKDVYEKYHLKLGDKDFKDNLYRITFERDPFAYLLALCDDLQDWDRRKPASTISMQKELTSKQVEVQIEDGGIIHFFYPIEGLDTKIKSIQELEYYLDNVTRFINKTII